MNKESGRYQSSPETSIGGRLAQEVYFELKERLHTGKYKPGKRISVEALQGELQVSRQPITQAFRALASEQIIEIVPQVGCIPIVYGDDEIRDFFSVFAETEGEIAKLAATRRSRAQIAKLRAVLETESQSFLSAPRSEGFRNYVHANRHFHGLVHQMAGTRVVAQLAKRMWDLSDYMIANFGSNKDADGSLHHRHQEHTDLADALEARDADRAKALMRTHIVQASGIQLGA